MSKTLQDVKNDMSALYDEVRNGTTELKTAAELANIAGKYLKAEQLELAREIFIKSLGHGRAADAVIEGMMTPPKRIAETA